VGGQRHASATLLYSRERDPVQESGWAPGPVYTDAENLAPTGIRFPDRPAHSVVAIPTTLRGGKKVVIRNPAERGCPTFPGKGPQTLLQAGLQAARVKNHSKWYK